MTKKETLLHIVWTEDHWGSIYFPSVCHFWVVYNVGKNIEWFFQIKTMEFCLDLLVDSRVSPGLWTVLLSTGILRCHKSTAMVIKKHLSRAFNHCCSAKDWNWKVKTMPKRLKLNTHAPPYSTVKIRSCSN